MNKKLVVIVASILFIAAAASASAQNVDTKIVGFESGIVYSYNVDAQDFGYANAFGINLTLTDNLVAGFIFKNAGAVTATMLTFSYGIADKYGMNLAVGQDTTPAKLVGVGMYYNIFERKIQDALVSVLKLKVAYEFDPSASIDDGHVVMGLGLVVGM